MSFSYIFRRIYRNIPKNGSLHWHFSNILPSRTLIFQILLHDCFRNSHAAYLKKLLIPISNETCLTKNSNVNFFLTHICLHSLEFFISYVEYEMRSEQVQIVCDAYMK